MAFCKFCGNQIDNDSVFCSSCGKRLSGSAQSVRYPPPPEPERQRTETAEQRAQRYRNMARQSSGSYGNAGGGSARQKSPIKYVIPAALAAFIAVMLFINSASNRSSGSDSGKKVVPPTPPVVSISIPPELFNVKPTVEQPESSPEPTDEVGDDEEELFENIGDNVVAVLSAITGRSDYILGSFEPLIGVTDVNGNGCAEILAVYETENNGTYEVRYDVWRAESRIASRVESDVLFYEIGGNGGVLHLLQGSDGAPYVMVEENRIMGETFNMYYCFYSYSDDETELELHDVMQCDGRYDTENGGIAEANYYTYYSDRVDISANEFKQYFDNYTTVYSLDIVSGEYDWDNTISFDWAWKLFGQTS